MLGRRLIYSHHIIARSKRRAIADLYRSYDLGGYAKIGWPGIIVIEGDEGACQSFCDDIRGMRWQHLAIRGEEHFTLGVGEGLDDARVFDRRMVELGEDDMSLLARICRERGCEGLFLTSMKIYDREGGDDDTSAGANSRGPDVIEGPEGEDRDAPRWRYGALVHVDHMNDGRGYRKWLRKTADSSNCDVLLKQCHAEDNPKNRAMILVGIMGDQKDVRRVFKRWRTSRVDVDARGQPCLERMMSVLIEGDLSHGNDLMDDAPELISLNSEKGLIFPVERLGDVLGSIGGPHWTDSFRNLLRPV